MPCYNSEVYIAEAIKSIIDQSFVDFELIIVNDGSTDTTQTIIESYKDNRINLINNDHSFIDSLNLGISNAKGKYIARMDADDIMVPERLQLQLDYLENNPNIDLCGGGMKLFGDGTNESHPSIDQNMLKLNLLHANQFSHPTIMMKTSLRELFPKENNIFQMYQKEYDCAEYYKLWIDLITKNCNITNISDILIHYRISENQVTRNNQSKMVQSSLQIQAEYMEFIMESIISQNPSFEPIFDNAFDLFNEGKIQFSTLKQIVYAIYREYL